MQPRIEAAAQLPGGAVALAGDAFLGGCAGEAAVELQSPHRQAAVVRDLDAGSPLTLCGNRFRCSGGHVLFLRKGVSRR
ncbi:hypothetical protein D3C84_1092560 [compost metagenome]